MIKESRRGGAVANKARRKEEIRALAAIICAVMLPLILAFVLVAADMRSDLSDLIPREALPVRATALIGWGDLGIPEGQPRRQVRMLGYMVDGYTLKVHKPAPDGSLVETFILLPEAGHILHPAHRIPEQMVEIWLARPAVFKFRSLVWATGHLARKAGRRDAEAAMYAMRDSDVKPAAQSDITRWFKP